MGDVTWVVKDPVPALGNYYTFSDAEWDIIGLFDGTRSHSEIVEEYGRRTGAAVDVPFVLEWEEELRKLDLVAQEATERNLELLKKFKTARLRAAEAKAEGFNPFFIQFRILDPNRFLDRTVKYVRWLWSPPVVALWGAAAVWTISVFIRNFAPLFEGTYELYAFLGKPLLDIVQFFLILSIIGGVHEMGHAYACKMYGGEVHDIGIALLYFTPAFYCDTTDAILFSNKWQRFWVTVAGIYVEGFICTAATALWVASYPDTLLHEIAFKTMLFTGVSTVFFNINPLMKIDGYFALTSILELPELREDSFRYIGAWVQKHVFRLPVELQPLSRRKRRTYWIYGVLALAYTLVIMMFIGGLFFNFYSKYFPNLAAILLALTLYRLFRKRVRLFTRTARLFYLDKKDLLMSARSRKAWMAAAVTVAALTVIPWTRRTIRAPALLEPIAQVSLEAPEDGVVADVLLGEGERVKAGQPIFRLSSPALEAQGVERLARRAGLAKQASEAREAGDSAGNYEAEQRESSVDAALASDVARQDRLVVRSPIAGRILTPRLEDLRGRHVTAGTLLAQVGDCRKLRANLAVSERRLDDLAAGQDVVALLPGRPFVAARGRIVSVSAATLAQPSTSAGTVDPALPAASPDKFVAVAVFDNADDSLKPGMMAKAKIYSRRASVVENLWRMLRRWVQTVVW